MKADNKPILDIKLPQVPLFDRGKIRDVFEAGENMLVVTTDRIYAFDKVYPGGMAGKGGILNALTLHSFKLAEPLVPNYLITSRVEDFPPEFKRFEEVLKDRTFLARRVKPVRLECVVRGFLYGQAWRAYRKGESLWEGRLASGLQQASELRRPIFTPARKNRTGDDENISRPDLNILLGESRAEELKKLCLKIYKVLRDEWEKRGFLLADTKMEFALVNDRLMLINEAGTTDCSRFWKRSAYRPGRVQDSWDKEILENYLRRKGWNPTRPPIPVSDYILRKMRDRFEELVSSI